MIIINYILLGGLIAGIAMLFTLWKPVKFKSDHHPSMKIKIHAKEHADGM